LVTLIRLFQDMGIGEIRMKIEYYPKHDIMKYSQMPWKK